MEKDTISPEDAAVELASKVSDAVDFLESEFSESWSTAERYFAGESDLETVEGRSSIIKTDVRDSIRAIMPSVMRVLLQSKKPVSYIPANVRTASVVERQELWINQHFYACDGYNQLYAAVHESLKMKVGPIKVYREAESAPQYIKVTNASLEDITFYDEQPDFVITDIQERTVDDQSPLKGTVTYDFEGYKYYENGKNVLEAFPIYEFFCERNATYTRLEDYVHGHRRLVTVAEAIEMGLPENLPWNELVSEGPETTAANEAATKRRGYSPDPVERDNIDILNQEFLLSETYCKFDLDGSGHLKKYCFYLGGANNQYLHHEEVEDFPISLVLADPIPFAVIGRSIVDIMKSTQDTSTSLLRAMIDNAHIANNPRPAGDPTRVNFADLMNNAIGAPIKTKGDAAIQLFDVPFTAGNLLPLLEYLETDGEQRVGVTKAARGLDPDALQSTDKNAVLNTIQLSQGTVELMVRNIVETGLIPAFRKLLKLSIRHLNPIQMLRIKGAVVPVDISVFDPDLTALPNVGLGTASQDQKVQTLGFIYAEQQKYMAQFGLDNPFTSLSQIYNTLEDLVEYGGINNVGRYFNYIDKRAEQVIAQKMAEQAAIAAKEAAENAPVDPSKVLLSVESLKARTKNMEIMSDERAKLLELQQRALEAAEKFDLERDRLAQERRIALTTLRRDDLNSAIVKEQSANDKDKLKSATNGSNPTLPQRTA